MKEKLKSDVVTFQEHKGKGLVLWLGHASRNLKNATKIWFCSNDATQHDLHSSCHIDMGIGPIRKWGMKFSQFRCTSSHASLPYLYSNGHCWLLAGVSIFSCYVNIKTAIYIKKVLYELYFERVLVIWYEVWGTCWDNPRISVAWSKDLHCSTKQDVST